MTINIRSIPEAAYDRVATPFKVFVPKQLTPETARPIWEALEQVDGVVLADPFALPNVSSVFPGVLYRVAEDYEDPYSLIPIARALEAVQEANPEDLADTWVELWVPESLEDEAEALDIQDLTQPPTP